MKYRCKNCDRDTAQREVDTDAKEISYYCVDGCGDYYGSSCQKVSGECILCNKECDTYKGIMQKRYENEVKFE